MLLEEIEERIEELVNRDDLLDFKLELLELAGHIQEDEEIEVITSCSTIEKKWLLTITDKRLFLYYQSLKCEIYNIERTRIKSIAIRKGFVQSDIILDLDCEQLHLTVKSKVAKQVYYALTCLVNVEKVDRNKFREEIENTYYKCINLGLVALGLICLGIYIYV